MGTFADEECFEADAMFDGEPVKGLENRRDDELPDETEQTTCLHSL